MFPKNCAVWVSVLHLRHFTGTDTTRVIKPLENPGTCTRVPAFVSKYRAALSYGVPSQVEVQTEEGGSRERQRPL